MYIQVVYIQSVSDRADTKGETNMDNERYEMSNADHEAAVDALKAGQTVNEVTQMIVDGWASQNVEVNADQVRLDVEDTECALYAYTAEITEVDKDAGTVSADIWHDGDVIGSVTLVHGVGDESGELNAWHSPDAWMGSELQAYFDGFSDSDYAQGEIIGTVNEAFRA